MDICDFAARISLARSSHFCQNLKLYITALLCLFPSYEAKLYNHLFHNTAKQLTSARGFLHSMLVDSLISLIPALYTQPPVLTSPTLMEWSPTIHPPPPDWWELLPHTPVTLGIVQTLQRLFLSERVSPTDSGIYQIVCVWVRCYNNSDNKVISIVLLYSYICMQACTGSVVSVV